MPVTQIPPRGPAPSTSAPPPPEPLGYRELSEAQHWETAYRGFNPDDVPHLLIQLQDDLARARKREAAWLSVILHLLVVILLWNSERLVALFPHRTVAIELPAKIQQDKDATFLELPPDEQKATRRPDTKVLSDKDRVAASKAPQVNREDLKKILEAARRGRPGPVAPQPGAGATPPPQPQAAQNEPQQTQQQNPTPSAGFAQPSQNDQTARLQAPPQGGTRAQPNFNLPMTAGSAIEQAARAAAENRGRYGGGGEAGDYGAGLNRGGFKALAPAEILTDTMGVDFGPYLTRVVQVVKANWYNIMPPSVYPPIRKQGKLAIEFAILKNGTVSGMTLRTPSGDVALDRAAWGSITASNPFPPLPREFVQQCSQPGREDRCVLGLRFYYFYNLDVDKDLQ
ncbi:MAG TPA: TonB family protein [Terriglobales bacterium]|nr:TonB family protein [Terriglobales bacterium]